MAQEGFPLSSASRTPVLTITTGVSICGSPGSQRRGLRASAQWPDPMGCHGMCWWGREEQVHTPEWPLPYSAPWVLGMVASRAFFFGKAKVVTGRPGPLEPCLSISLKLVWGALSLGAAWGLVWSLCWMTVFEEVLPSWPMEFMRALDICDLPVPWNSSARQSSLTRSLVLTYPSMWRTRPRNPGFAVQTVEPSIRSFQLLSNSRALGPAQITLCS